MKKRKFSQEHFKGIIEFIGATILYIVAFTGCLAIAIVPPYFLGKFILSLFTDYNFMPVSWILGVVTCYFTYYFVRFLLYSLDYLFPEEEL